MSGTWQYQHVHDYLTMHRRVTAFFAEHPAGKVRLRWTDEVNKEEYHREFLKALDHRINLKCGPYPSWRNWDNDQHWRFYRDQQAVQRHFAERVSIYQFETKAARKRLSHLISEREW